jgi:hypothetical protein
VLGLFFDRWITYVPRVANLDKKWEIIGGIKIGGEPDRSKQLKMTFPSILLLNTTIYFFKHQT